jgi:hypothetical protein
MKNKQDIKVTTNTGVIAYNVEYWKHWSEADFVAQQLKEKALPDLKNDTERELVLREHYKLINPPEKETSKPQIQPQKKEGV